MKMPVEQDLLNFRYGILKKANLNKGDKMNNLPNCPKCNSEYVYEDGALLVCPEVRMNGTQLRSKKKRVS